jgi:nucleoid DNA-binding protein
MSANGAVPVSESVLIAEVTDNLGNGYSQSDVRKFVKALKETIVANLAEGYKVSLSGVVSIEPQAKKGRKKGTVVRNPFDGSTRKLTADEPDKFKVKARASSAMLKSFPTTRTSAGKQLLQQLSK